MGRYILFVLDGKGGNKALMKLRIFTDGACSGNPGIGGWACVYLFPKKIVKISGGNRHTTNNRMELTAVIQALKQFEERYCHMDVEKIEIYSDSAYVVNSISQNWVDAWHKNRWETKEGKAVKNYDLWREYIKLVRTLNWIDIKVELIKVEGHAGIQFNEMADELAKGEVTKRKGIICKT